MSDRTPPPSAKPGTACLGCRRRKLRCSREQEGCVNCTKAELPCVYPAPETGIKRKRGPYKKDKPPRERHLEDLVRYLEPKNSETVSTQSAGAGEGHAGSATRRHDGRPERLAVLNGGTHQSSHAEDLVKDALIALTRSTVSDRESNTESREASTRTLPYILSPPVASGNLHPPARLLFEYWYLFVTRFDPLTKVVHCPTLAKKLFTAIDNPESIGSATETLLFSIYYAAVITCTANEARRRFGESRDALLQRFGRVIEAALADSYGMPALELMQAVVVYTICVRRQDNGTNVRTLFGLAARMAQLVGLHEDPGESYRPLEAELRRRLWWHIGGLESRGAEEGGTRTTSIMTGRKVQLPANLNDYDVDATATELPQNRAGVTQMTYVLLRFEILSLVHHVMAVRRQQAEDGQQLSSESLRSQQAQVFEVTRTRLQDDYVQHFDKSRPYDFMCLHFLEGMLIKTRMIIEYPIGQVPSRTMSTQERSRLLQYSVDIINATHVLAVDNRIDAWLWFFRGYVQWHSLAIVVAELGHSNNKQFAHSAWAVLDPILADWAVMYETKKGEPAWEHVNTLIERAKQSRHTEKKGDAAMSKSNEESPVHPIDLPPTENTPAPATYLTKLHAIPEASINHDPVWEAQKAGAVSTPQQAPTPRSLDEHSSSQPAAFSCTPLPLDIETDFTAFDGLEQIDFQAFDAVFGGAGWQFPSPMAEFSMEAT